MRTRFFDSFASSCLHIMINNPSSSIFSQCNRQQTNFRHLNIYNSMESKKMCVFLSYQIQRYVGDRPRVRS